MIATAMAALPHFTLIQINPDRDAHVLEMYRFSVPLLYFSFLVLWLLSTFRWAIANWNQFRHRQRNDFQLNLASIPLFKALHLALLLIYWYSCANFQVCTWWSPGVVVTGLIFQGASHTSFMLIHELSCLHSGHHHCDPSVTAVLSYVGFYISGLSYIFGLPYFKLFFLLTTRTYLIGGSGNRRLILIGVDNEDDERNGEERTAMFRKFQYALLIGCVVEIIVDIYHMFTGRTPENLFFRLLVREAVQFCILLYIGSIFRLRERLQKGTPDLSTLPPLYTVEMDASDFSDLRSQESHVGEATLYPSARNRRSMNSPPVVIVQHPHEPHGVER